MRAYRSRAVDPVTAEVFRHLFISVAEEMGAVLEQTAYSPNIKERRDHSCAVFDADGALLAQAAHIPVHLGAFPLLMRALVPRFPWRRGDVVLCNDPFVGGTHLPDLSLVCPVFTTTGRRAGFVASRAHHADVGGMHPGSMGPATSIYQEGLIIPPVKLADRGRMNEPLRELVLRNVRTPGERRGDLDAQLAADATGSRRFESLLARYGPAEIRRQARAVRQQTRRAAERLIASLPPGPFYFTDVLDDDGQGNGPLPICVRIEVCNGRLRVDFTGSVPQQPGAVNATLAVAHAAVYYTLICLLPEATPVNEGLFDAVEIVAPAGSIVNATAPAAVAAGNVETSQRMVDALFGALEQALPGRIPAASQGTMNNLTLGGTDPATGRAWTYYETLGGGAGASPDQDGCSGIHCHMSNTRNTPAEAMEYHYPLRVTRYALRDGSGGAGRHHGGLGVVREVEALAPATATLLTDRRAGGPYGLHGGGDGAAGRNEVNDGDWREVPAKGTLELEAGDRLRISTPGGGGWGAADEGEGVKG
jgi:N-methylhydantoinase B